MELFTDRPGDDGLPGRERCFAMVATMVSTLMVVFDGSMVNIALPKMADALAVSAAGAVWFSNGYLLSVAMTLAIFSALATRVGFRAQFVFGLCVFTLASLGCALSSTSSMLIAMRILQGVGGAATLSIAPAILRSVFPSRVLGRILGLNALLIAAGTAVAPVIGGTLLDTWGWQWLFAVNIVPGCIALMFAVKAIPSARSKQRKPFDALGAVLSAVMVGSAIMVASGTALSGAGWYALAALVSGVAFVVRIRRVDSPLIPPSVFSSARFSLAALTSMTSFVGQGITFVSLPFLFQDVYGYSAFASALLLTPWPVGIVLVAPHAGRLADKYPAALISTVGLCLFVAGVASLALMPVHPHVWNIGVCCLLCGAGFGCFQSPNNREMLLNVPRENSSYASGVLAIARTFGQCLGAALVGVVLSVYAHGGSAIAQAQGVGASLWLAVAVTVLALLFSLGRLPIAWRQNRPAAGGANR